jgi:hypothetical protein
LASADGAFLETLFRAIFDEEVMKLHKLEEIEPMDVAGTAATLATFQLAAASRRAPMHTTVYRKQTLARTAARDEREAAKALTAEAEAAKAAKAAKWAARLKELQSDQAQARAARAAQMRSDLLGSVPTDSNGTTEQAPLPTPPPPTPPRTSARLPAGAQPVTHWQDRRPAADADSWFTQAQHWLHGHGRGYSQGRAAGHGASACSSHGGHGGSSSARCATPTGSVASHTPRRMSARPDLALPPPSPRSLHSSPAFERANSPRATEAGAGRDTFLTSTPGCAAAQRPYSAAAAVLAGSADGGLSSMGESPSFRHPTSSYILERSLERAVMRRPW